MLEKSLLGKNRTRGHQTPLPQPYGCSTNATVKIISICCLNTVHALF
jgi:hypothetical protein